jgi:amino acid permease
MNKPLSLALFAGGIILIIYGVSASNSTASGLSRIFSGNPTDRTMWLLIGGVAAAIVGLVGLLRRPNVS